MSVAALRDRDSDLDARLAAARHAWGDGRRDEAQRRWRMIVARAPDLAAPYVNLAGAGGQAAAGGWVEKAARALTVADPVAVRNLGVLAHRRGEISTAYGRLRRAAMLDPGDPATARLLARLPGNCAPAHDTVRWSVRSALGNPAQDDRWIDLLTRLLHDRRLSEAADWCDRLPIATEACSTTLLRLVAHSYTKTSRDVAALPVLARLTAREPREASLRTLLAVAHRRTGDARAAVAEARRAVLISPDSDDAVGSLGTELTRAEEHDEAARLFRRLLRCHPGRRPEALENLGAALVSLNAQAEARAVLRESAVRRPQASGGYLNLSTLALQAVDLETAARYGRIALAIEPGMADAHYSLASIRRHQGRPEAARAHFDAAMALDDKPLYRFVRAMLELGDGDPEDGLQRYEARWDVPSFSSSRRLGSTPTLALPVWQGERRPEATLAVWAEQGIGDELWFAGYLNWVIPRVGRVVLEVADSLVTLLRRSFPAVDVRSRDAGDTEAAIAAADLQIPLGSLARLCGAARRPVPTGYLRPDPVQVEALRRQYTGDRPDVRVFGISWRSVKPLRTRSFEAPLSAWGPLFAIDGAAFVSLQYGDVEADARLVEQRFGRRLIHNPRLDAYRDLDTLAAQTAAVDGVVSIANSTVSIAHGLGKPVHVIARIVQDDWRYARGAPTARWLPTARCVWQTDGDDWQTPIRLLVGGLRRGF